MTALQFGVEKNFQRGCFTGLENCLPVALKIGENTVYMALHTTFMII